MWLFDFYRSCSNISTGRLEAGFPRQQFGKAKSSDVARLLSGLSESRAGVFLLPNGRESNHFIKNNVDFLDE